MALRVRADARPLLRRGLERPREARRRPRALARGDDLDRAARRRVDRLRRAQPARLRPARAVARAHRARRAHGVGVVGALQPAGGVAPGRRDDRDGDGGERLLRHHPGPLGADPRQGGGTRAGSAAGDPGEAALGPQQLPHAAGPPDDARGALPVRVRRRPRVARARRPHGDRCVGTALLQPPPHRPDALVDGRRRRGGVCRHRRRRGARRRDRGGTRRCRRQRARQARVRRGRVRRLPHARRRRRQRNGRSEPRRREALGVTRHGACDERPRRHAPVRRQPVGEEIAAVAAYVSTAARG